MTAAIDMALALAWSHDAPSSFALSSLLLALLLPSCSPSCDHGEGLARDVSTRTPRATTLVDDGTDDEAGVTPRREAISGYATPGELLLISSRRQPDGVVAVTLPPGYDTSPDQAYPLVIAFGGAGECAREPRDGALAWMRYYKADEAIAALTTRRLVAADFRGLATPAQLVDFNRRLEAAPYRGVILACPSAPPISRNTPLDDRRYAAFLLEEVIPALRATYRVLDGRIGIDGVSMGGARSMYYGLEHPEVFASIGAVQGAFGRYMEQYRAAIAKNRDALSERPIQLVTSDGDSLAPATERLHDLLREHGVDHDLVRLSGPHDYVFNQGPGVISLLTFHDRELRSEGSRTGESLGVAGDDR